MEREYKDENGSGKALRPGLKIVHIGDDVWKIGKHSYVDDPAGRTDMTADGKAMAMQVLHTVIYGPNRSEHHLYGDDVRFIHTEIDTRYTVYDKSDYGSVVNRHGNIAIESAAKVYILTSILDKRTNWCFDLEQIPEPGPLKVIYFNGTVKNIQFTGTFEPVVPKGKTRSIYPIAYRKIS